MIRRALVALVLVAGCSSAPTGEWRTPDRVEVALESTWPPRLAARLVTERAVTPALLLLDTGTEEAAIDARRVESLDLERTWPPRVLVVQGLAVEQGGVGEQTATERRVPAIELPGAVKLREVPVLPLPMPRGIDGAVGLSAFPGRALVLDPVRERLAFVPRAAVPALLAADGVVRIPSRRDGDLLVATIGIHGRGAVKRLEVVFDTGAQDSFVTPEALAGLPAPLEDPLFGSEEVAFALNLGPLDIGERRLRVERRGRFCTLGGGVLLRLGRPVLFDLEGGTLALLPEPRPGE